MSIIHWYSKYGLQRHMLTTQEGRKKLVDMIWMEDKRKQIKKNENLI